MTARANPIAGPTLFDLPEPDVCARRHGGSRESQEAHGRAEPLADALRELIVRNLGSEGLTCEEVAGRMQLRYTTASARMSELKREGRIVPAMVAGTALRRRTSSGCWAQVYRVAR